MHPHAIHWEWIIFGLFKVLKAFGLIPGALAAFGLRKLYQKWRQRRAESGWPATDARVHSVELHAQGARSYWTEITYTYFVGEYRSGKHVHRFRRKQEAEEFVRQIRGKHVLVHYDTNKPDTSVILDRDLEMVALLAPQYR
jgi:hypothetical protein